jgi:hypothetical protein
MTASLNKPQINEINYIIAYMLVKGTIQLKVVSIFLLSTNFLFSLNYFGTYLSSVSYNFKYGLVDYFPFCRKAYKLLQLYV